MYPGNYLRLKAYPRVHYLWWEVRRKSSLRDNKGISQDVSVKSTVRFLDLAVPNAQWVSSSPLTELRFVRCVRVITRGFSYSAFSSLTHSHSGTVTVSFSCRKFLRACQRPSVKAQPVLLRDHIHILVSLT